MKIREQYIEEIPEYWLPYLINGDRDGILFNEFIEIREFEKANLDGFNSVIYDPSFKDDNEHYFGQFNGIGHTLIDVQITKF